MAEATEQLEPAAKIYRWYKVEGKDQFVFIEKFVHDSLMSTVYFHTLIIILTIDSPARRTIVHIKNQHTYRGYIKSTFSISRNLLYFIL